MTHRRTRRQYEERLIPDWVYVPLFYILGAVGMCAVLFLISRW